MKSKKINGISLAIQWLRLCASSAEGTGSIPGQGIKIPHVMRHSQRNFFKNEVGLQGIREPMAKWNAHILFNRGCCYCPQPIIAMWEPRQCVCVLGIFFFFLSTSLMTCGILVPRPGMEPRALSVRESPNHWTTREFLGYFKRSWKFQLIGEIC